MFEKFYSGSSDLYIVFDTGVDNKATYTFFDEYGDTVKPEVGNKFRRYKITGRPTSNRFYCVHSITKIHQFNISWSKNLYGTLIGTKTDFGTGRKNTNKCIPLNSDKNSIFYHVNKMNQHKMYGYNDWFIPSLDELKEMESFLLSIGHWTYATNKNEYFRRIIYTSSEYILPYDSDYYPKHYAYCVNVYKDEYDVEIPISKEYYDENGIECGFIPFRAF